jgi:NAD kinase
MLIASKVNEGTTLFCDGLASAKLLRGDKIVIGRSQNSVQLIENPGSRQWRSLAEKLNWAIGPKYNGQ